MNTPPLTMNTPPLTLTTAAHRRVGLVYLMLVLLAAAAALAEYVLRSL